MAKNSGQGAATARARTYVSQADVPGFSLEKALKIPSAIADNYGYKPTSPLQVAKALGVQPSSGPFRLLTGAAIAYGLTTGGYNADVIAISPLGLRIVRPTTEGDDLAAKREALLRPRVIREFLQKYDRAALPKDEIGQNVLVDFGVPPDRTADVLALIIEGAQAVGFLQDIKDRKYVELGSTVAPADESTDVVANLAAHTGQAMPAQPALAVPKPSIPAAAAEAGDARSKKVFITHGKNKNFVEPIKGLLSFGELEPVVATESQTASLPVPLKVMGHMRSCGAAIIHVEGERKLFDADTKEVVALNENVLIEIGAAMALYGDRFILLVKEGVKLPSNLQGLYEVRYTGDVLDANDTVKLLGAIKDMKNRPLPVRP